MKVKSLVIIILCVLLLCSCSIFTDVEKTPSPSTSPSPEASPTATPDYTESWASAKKLVWIIDMSNTHGVDPQIYIDFNNLLLEKGADFIVEFVGIDSMNVMEYSELIRNMKSEGRQVDLLETGYGQYGVDYDTYPEAVKDGLLEPLDEYLKTADGQKLYKAFDKNAWESVKIENKIYGINNRSSLRWPFYLHINKEIQEKHNIRLPEGNDSLSYLESTLKIIAENQDVINNKDIISLLIGQSSVKKLMNCEYMDSGIAVKYDNKGYPLAFNLFEEADFISLIDLIYSYINQGLIMIGENVSVYKKMDEGLFFATFQHSTPDDFYNNKLMLDGGKAIDVVSYKLSEDYVISQLNLINGIASWSENKEEAFKLLTMINTDSDLSNLLRYGILGKQYELVDGKVSFLEAEARAPGYYSPANQMITHPIGLEPSNKAEVYKELNAASIMSPIAGFTLDKSKIEDKLSAIKGIYDKYEKIYTGETKNIKEELKKANSELKDQGIDEVLDEINLQLTSWWKSKGN